MNRQATETFAWWDMWRCRLGLSINEYLNLPYGEFSDMIAAWQVIFGGAEQKYTYESIPDWD